MEIYIEPYLPPPCLLIMGASPIAEALVRLGVVLGYRVWVMDPAATEEAFPEAERVVQDFDPRGLERGGETYAVVATMGHFDEEALQAAAALEPRYLGMVASPRKFAEMTRVLKAKGLSVHQIEEIRNPAGLDIHAKLSGEVALSILAEIIQVRRSRGEQAGPIRSAGEAPAPVAKDPICGMMVEKATARYVVEHGGVSFYFCCGHCQERFQQSPQKYLVATEAAER